MGLEAVCGTDAKCGSTKAISGMDTGVAAGACKRWRVAAKRAQGKAGKEVGRGAGMG